MRTFRDRVAVVTGAASGIGRATAVELAKRGADVALADVEPLGLEESARIVRALGRRASTWTVDVADRDAVAGFAAGVVREHGVVHLLMNNAGVSLVVPFQDATLEDYDWLMNVNFWGVVNGCHAFLPHLRKADQAWIVNVSSIFGCIGVPNQTAYCASKFAVRGFTEALDLDLRGTTVGVTCVHPGAVATGIVRNGRFRSAGEGPDLELSNKLIDSGLSPEAAARIIVDGVGSGARRIIVGRDARLFDRAARLFPTGYRAGVRWWGRMVKRRTGK